MAEQARNSVTARVLIEWLPATGLIDLQGQGDVIGPLAQHLNLRLPAEANGWLASPQDKQLANGPAPAEPGKPAATTGLSVSVKSEHIELEPLPLRACWLAPNHWLLFVPFRQDVQWAKAIESCAPGAVATSVGDAYIGVRLTGPGVVEVLAQGCPLDVDHFSAGNSARTLLARCSVLLLATAHDGTEFELWVERSYRDYLHNWLTKANGI